jgi:two-component system alkaline phosphatase synthesis response regulator PhoP
MPAKVLFVEDDQDIRDLVLYALKSHNFPCEGFEDGEAFFSALDRAAALPGLILLDIMLPAADGLTILKRLRAHARYRVVPVIMLSAKGSEADKVKGLDQGADDYIAKPFGVTELIARIKAVLRRAGAPDESKSRLTYKQLVLDNDSRSVTAGGRRVEGLTFMEFELLHYLLLNVDIVLSRDRLMAAVWGQESETETRTVDAHIRTLRQKLGDAGAYVKTVRQVGYKIGE